MSCFTFVVFSALIVGALADSFIMPKLPCEWSLIWNVTDLTNPSDYWYNIQHVHGRFVRMKRVKQGVTETLIRSDLDNSLLAKFVHSNTVHSEDYVSLDSVKDMYKMYSFIDKELTFFYDTKTRGSFDGKDCFVYSGNSGADLLYTDDNEIPMALLEGKYWGIFTWQWKADIDLFVFPRNISFNDERVYTPPKDELKVWEEQSTECEQNSYECDSGSVHFNSEFICLGDVNNPNICVKDRCGMADEFTVDKAAALINVKSNKTKDDVNITELIKLISKETKIKEDTIDVVLSVDSNGYVIQVVVFTKDNEDATIVAVFADELSQSNCTTSILCETTSSSTEEKKESELDSLDSGHRGSSLCLFALIMLMVVAFVVY